MSKLLIGAEAGTDQDTFVLRISDTVLDRDLVARAVALALAGYSNGADIAFGVGVWDEVVEISATITVQGERHHAEIILARLAEVFPRLRFVHVEVHKPSTQYVDLDVYRTPAPALADVG